MAEEPESHNKITGNVTGNAFQGRDVHGDVHFHGQQAQQAAKYDIWLALAGSVTFLSALALLLTLYSGPIKINGTWSSGAEGTSTVPVALVVVAWQFWSARRLFNRHDQADQRDWSAGLFSLWLGLGAVYLASGATYPWALLVVAAVPVCAVLFAEAGTARRLLLSWSLGLVVQVVWVAASTADTFTRSDPRPVWLVWWVPLAGAAVVALLSARVKDGVSAAGA